MDNACLQFPILDTNCFWVCLRDLIMSACDLFIPKISLSAKSSPRWFNSNIRHSLNQIHTLRRSIRRNSSSQKLAKLSDLEKMLEDLIISSKVEYESHLFSSFASNPKKLYSHLNSLKSFSSPKFVVHKSTTLCSPCDKAEAFNSFFHSTFTSSVFCRPIDCMPTPSSQLNAIYLETEEVYQALSRLDPYKATGCDEMHPSVLKHSAHSLCEPIAMLFNQSLSTCIVPKEWKIHKIHPIPKSKSVSDIANYRPISLLCVLSKVLESLVYDKIIDFLRPKFTSSQFGFLKNRSCLLQLLLSHSNILNSFDLKKSSDVIFLDFSKTFDSVPHGELLFKVWKLGITGPLWFWLQSYLTGRQHYVSVDGVCSTRLPVLSGVPQGSVLGPLLFLIYVNDLPDCISSASCFLFADDVKLVNMIASINDHVLLQRDLDSLADWCYIWKLRLNKNKCFSITYSRSAIVSSTYFIGDHLIELVSSHRDLGITTSQDFTWSLHYDKICKAAFGSLQLIHRNISASHSVSVKRLLYITLVRSHFAYCSQLWRPNLLKDISRLERVQRKATKFILSDYLSC